MDNAAPDRPAIIRSVASKRRRETISMIVAFALMLALLARILMTARIEYRLAMLVVLALLAPYLARETFSNLNSRCPACKGVMGSVIVRARFCPMCGTQLVPDDETTS